MSQSTFKWIIVFDDGTTTIIEAQPDNLTSIIDELVNMNNVLSIVRGDFV